MKTFVAISMLTASTLAQAPAYFGVMSTRSASPVHLLPFTARGGNFFLGGGPPSSYCPPEVGQENCPPGNSTVLAGGDEYLGLGVVVPGGQQVYVGPKETKGALGYTPPHSTYKPEGSIVDGWSRTEGEQFGSLSWSGGLIACPGEEGQGWQVFGQIEGVEHGTDCLGFNALTINTTEPGAWEY